MGTTKEPTWLLLFNTVAAFRTLASSRTPFGNGRSSGQRRLVNCNTDSIATKIYIQIHLSERWLIKNPMEEVVCNDDLLTAILIRLPPKSIYRFMCVSNSWNNIIDNPFFLKSYSSKNKEPRPGGGCLLSFIETTIPVPAAHNNRPPMNVLRVARVNNIELGRFISSSNGIILCGTHPDTYFLLNPVTGKTVSLPPPGLFCKEYPAMALVCKESTYKLVPNYKVFRTNAGEVVGKTLVVEIYSSETGEWKESIMTCTENLSMSICPPLIVNGVIHWFDIIHWKVAVYDSAGGENHVQCINVPRKGGGFWEGISRSSCVDALWFHKQIGSNLNIWMLPNKGESRSYRRSSTISEDEWIFMHAISWNSLTKDAGDILTRYEKRETKDQIDANGTKDESTSLVFKSNMALALPKPNMTHIKVNQRIFLFNLESGSLDQVVEYTGAPTTGAKEYAEYYCDSYPYLESLSLCSYAL